MPKRIEHIEDIVFIKPYEEIPDYLSLFLKCYIQPDRLSIKWDGAPGFYVGYDPEDGQFFVSKKGIFNVNPKVYKSIAEIDKDNRDKELVKKLTIIFNAFEGKEIDGIIHGDFIFKKEDLQRFTHMGESYIGAHPNTIIYAVPEKSKAGQEISKAEFGVAWHTRFRGKSFKTILGYHEKKIHESLKEIEGMYCFHDEVKKVDNTLPDLINQFFTIDKNYHHRLVSNISFTQTITIFINSLIRSNRSINDMEPENLLNEYREFLDNRCKSGMLSEVHKSSIFKLLEDGEFLNVVHSFISIARAKDEFIHLVTFENDVQSFLEHKILGKSKTFHEGLVAENGSTMFKIVDRGTFSKANFSGEYEKGWK